MRILPLALALLLAACALPQGTQAQAATVDYAIRPSEGTTQLAVNLQAAAVDIRFTVDTAEYPAFSNVQGLVVRLAQGANQTQVQLQSPAAQGVSGTVWRGVLPSSHRDLTRGVHNVTVQVAAGGQAGPLDSVARTLTATATETGKPVISASQAVNRTVRLGPGDDLSVLVDDASPSAGIHAVTYRIQNRTATLPLEFPYIVRGASLGEGVHRVVVNATDRALNRATANLTVIVDSQAPAINVTLPTDVFVGVANRIVVQASDLNPYNVTFTEGGRTVASPGTGPARTHEHTLRPAKAGPVPLTVRARDILGNSVERSYTLTARILETDTQLASVAATPQHPLAGEPLQLRIVAKQATGFVPLDVNVTLSGPVTATHNVTLPASGNATKTLTHTVPVGRHRLTVRVQAPAGVVELNGSDQEQSLDVEVFFAKVAAANETYYIRASDIGVPEAAVTAAGASYPLRLVQDGASIAYEFTANGQVLEWDPVPDGNTTDPTPTDKPEGKDSPGPAAALAALVLVGVAAWARRRR